MPDQKKVFKTLKIIIVSLVVILIAINILYTVTAFSDRRCTTVNIATIALLLWATALWIMVLRYSKKQK